jgi:hypothetical protein
MPPQFGFYPTNNWNYQTDSPPWTPGNAYGPIHFHILPYMEQDNLYKSTAYTGWSPSWSNWTGVYYSYNAAGHSVKSYLASADPTPNITGSDRISYGVNYDAVYDRDTWTTNVRFPSYYQDGTSNTIIYGEQYSQWAWNWSGNTEYFNRHYYDGTNYFYGYDKTYDWSGGGGWRNVPRNPPFQIRPQLKDVQYDHAQSFATSGINVSFMDGSCRQLNSAISGTTFMALCTPHAGDLPGNDY